MCVLPRAHRAPMLVLLAVLQAHNLLDVLDLLVGHDLLVRRVPHVEQLTLEFLRHCVTSTARMTARPSCRRRGKMKILHRRQLAVVLW